MNYFKAWFFIIVSLGLAQTAEAGAVIVSADSALTSASAESVRQVYLGKSESLEGTRVTPFDQSADSDVRAGFYEAVVGMKAAQAKSYWAKQVFTGKGTPPEEIGSDADIVSAVASNSAAIGYVSDAAVTADVRVIFEF